MPGVGGTSASCSSTVRFDRFCRPKLQCVLAVHRRIYLTGLADLPLQTNVSRISRSVAKRSKENPWGRTQLPFVQNGNEQAIRLAIQMLLAFMLRVHFTIEQPTGSLLNYFPPVKQCMALTTSESVPMWTGSYGGTTPKPLKLMGNAPHVGELQTGRPNLSQLAGRTFICIRDANGRRHVTGLAAHLGLSGAYTKEFGRAHASAFLGHAVA